MTKENPYLRYHGNGVFSHDFSEALPRHVPSFRARLLGAGKPIIKLPSLPTKEPLT